jgi:photosystem II stability/assembly factor-like uncharacterized protein
MATKTKFLVGVSLFVAAFGSAHAGFWQPLCPDGALCATSKKAFVADGRVLISPEADAPSQWVSVSTLAGAPTAMRDISVKSNNKYLAVSGTQFTAYDLGGNLLYSVGHTSIESWAIFESQAKRLGPALVFGATSPATVLTGLTGPGEPPYIYLTQNDGVSIATQQANVLIAGNRTNFAISADGQRVWVVPGPATAGLWQTPAATGAAKLDFTQLTRVDDGSFPASAFHIAVVPAAAIAGGYSVALATDGMYVSTNAGRTWSRASFSGVVDDLVFTGTNSADGQLIAARGSVFKSNDRGQTWIEVARGLPLDRYELSVIDGGVIADGAVGLFFCGALDCNGGAFGTLAGASARSVQVTEFYNTTLDHYFITADESEKASIRVGGSGPGWIETGQNFWAWTPSVIDEAALVCRFYGDYIKGPNSHFYSASTDECRSLLGLQDTLPAEAQRWNSEGYAFKLSLPNAAGQCGSGFVPVHRAYNNGFARGIDSNHRYATDPSLLAPLIARGWKSEGVAFCAPAAVGS